MAAPTGEIAAILFDKDGTLVDYDRTWGPLNRAAALHAAGGDAAFADRLLALGGHDAASGRVRGGSLLAAYHTRQIAAAWVEAGAAFDPDRLAADMDALFAEGAENAVPVTDVAALFDRLQRRGLQLGVATSDGERAARRTLAGLGVPADTVFVAGYDSGHGAKPEPGMVHGFARAAGVDSARVAVVGDNTHDLHMAHAAGCAAAIGVLTGTTGRAELAPHADAVLDSIADLERFLDERTEARGA